MNTYTATIQANPENFTFKLPYTYISTSSVKCVVSGFSNYLLVTFYIANPINEQTKRTMRRAIKTIASMASSTCEPALEVRDQNNKVYSLTEANANKCCIVM